MLVRLRRQEGLASGVLFDLPRSGEPATSNLGALRSPILANVSSQGTTMKLLDFARQLPENYSEQEFVDLMNQVIDLKAIATLPAMERSALFDGV